MLHNIEKDGTISWHCITSTCSYHNCAQWDREIACSIHLPGITGKTHTTHISDNEVQWVNLVEILLPVCLECGSRWTLRVHDDEELTPPIITRDEITGKILQVAPSTHPKYSHNLWIKDADIIRKHIPHPTLLHLTPEQIHQIQADIRNKAPDAPIDWMMTEVTTEDIHDVYQHPAVARHRELAWQLMKSGKTPIN